jgi:hypothetical protein
MRKIQLVKRLAALMSTLLLVGLTACGGGTDLQTASLQAGPLTAGKARVAITRVSGIMYSAAPATITVNGQKVADVAAGSSVVFDVAAGQNVIAASAWSYPGNFSVKLNAKAGQTYSLAVEPRTDSMLPGALLGPIGGPIDASVNENAGAFQLTLVPGAAAAAASPKGASEPARKNSTPPAPKKGV